MKFPKKDIIVIVTWIISIIGFIIIVPKLFKFFEPVIIGAIISLIIYPIVRFLEKKLKIIKPIGIIVISALIIGILGIILYFIFGFISNEILLLVKNLPNIYDDFSNGLDEIIEYINSFAPNINGFNESMIIDANSLQLSLPSYDTILQ